MTAVESPAEPAAEFFSDRYLRSVAARGRLCVGIDPHAELLARWGLTDDVDGLARFTDATVQAFAGEAAVIKPQVAFFERFGSAGIAVLERTIAACRDGGALVIADAKRGDIGSTMAAYADAWLGDRSPLCSDAMTASPFLGFGALEPAIALARSTGRGVVALARTSNPEGASLQGARTDSVSVAQAVVDGARTANAIGGVVGVVVGATRDHGLNLTELGAPILAPGLGAQGATAADIARIFDGVHRWILPAASRQILAAGPDVTALRAAVRGCRDEIESVLTD